MVKFELSKDSPALGSTLYAILPRVKLDPMGRLRREKGFSVCPVVAYTVSFDLNDDRTISCKISGACTGDGVLRWEDNIRAENLFNSLEAANEELEKRMRKE